MKFADIFRFTRRTGLVNTYRFNERLLAASSKFIMHNPVQLRKQLVAATSSELPAIVVLSGAVWRNTGTAPVAHELEEQDDTVFASLPADSLPSADEVDRLERRSRQSVTEGGATSETRGRKGTLVDLANNPWSLLLKR